MEFVREREDARVFCGLRGHGRGRLDIRFVGKNRSASVFLGLDPTVLYRLAALPDEKAATLTPDTLLTDPRTGRQTALSQMSTRSLDRAQRIMGLLADQLAEPVSRPRDAVLSEERALYGAGRASNEGIVNLHYKDLKFYSSGLIPPSLMEKA